MNAALIMAAVALLCFTAAVFLFVRPTRGDASVYRNRIAATMLLAGAIILTSYAWALHSWDAA